MLYQGLSYEAIAKRLMISTATVTRVAHWLHHGMDGYRAVASRMFPKGNNSISNRHPRA